MSQWQQQWDVPGSTGRIYKVSRDYSGNYACSCPQWIYKRDDCKHIKAVRIFEGIVLKKLDAIYPISYETNKTCTEWLKVKKVEKHVKIESGK